MNEEQDQWTPEELREMARQLGESLVSDALLWAADRIEALEAPKISDL